MVAKDWYALGQEVSCSAKGARQKLAIGFG
jgi:hypothetical protein